MKFGVKRTTLFPSAGVAAASERRRPADDARATDGRQAAGGRWLSGLGAAAATLALAGCAMQPATRETVDRNFSQQREAWDATDWLDVWDKMTGWNEYAPNDEEREAKADKKLCINSYGEERVVTANGTEDEVDYRRCSVGPYPSQLGQRVKEPDTSPW